MHTPDLIIRREQEEDYPLVEQLVRDAFWDVHVPGCCEHLVIHNLRKSQDFIPELDFIAEKDRRIVGQIAYARSAIRGENGQTHEVITFGPVSVIPELQNQGIGSLLITHTIALARGMGFPAIVIYGDPRYYSRFGFRCAEKYDIRTFDGKFAAALLALELKPGALANMPGNFVESAAYSIDEEQLAQYDAGFPFKEKKDTESQREFRFIVSLRY
ncbi:GNAT family N-acetyltransferase [Dehalogenimonas etheniformans]|uniref:N-acetyltransferase n=1 Tax=Dehalogenimonas etheniformans TaxID=1536648 RepID=A0A2P5P8X8_9CHLR|nr:N-acetyltransferase [Dehalogenimonas etheniformans]PPD58762.1 N-acetyltransferase [Dehalogenimonas etheniformans]QNT76467.1 N-acetyltransferase [Dehalogenimonas etheniformans]